MLLSKWWYLKLFNAMKSLLKTGLRAGAVAGVTTGLGIAAPAAPSSVQEAFAPDRIMQHLQYQGFTQAVGCSVDALMGDRHAFHRFGANVAAGTVGAVGAGAIGLGLKDNPVIHKLAHGILGAATGAMLGGKDGAVAGAMGAITAEIVAETITPFFKGNPEEMVDKALIRAEELGLDPTEENLNTLVQDQLEGYVEISQLGAAVTALFTGTDAAIATTTAQTAVENNSLKVLARILQPLVQRASQTATVKALKEWGKRTTSRVTGKTRTAAKRASSVPVRTFEKTESGFGVTNHGVSRKIERGIKTKDELDALRNPLKIKEIRIDKKTGLPSQRFVGEKSSVVINPLTKKIVSVNPTASSIARKLLKDMK